MNNKFKLLIDATGQYSHLYLIDNKSIIDHLIYKNNQDLSIKLNDYFNQILMNNHYSIDNISDLYLVYGPGKFSAMRICSVFVKTIKLIYPSINLWILDRFHFLSNGYNYILIDADGHKYFKALLDKQTMIEDVSIINQAEFDQLVNNQQQIKIVVDYNDDDSFVIDNLVYFQLVDENFELTYFKNQTW